MKRSFSLGLILPVLILLPVGYRTAGWLLQTRSQPVFDAEMSRGGEELFAHEWTAHDPLAAGGDGLGPVFNAASCVACHRQGGAGGSGPLENNVTTFLRRHGDADAQQGVVHASAIDASFQETLNTVAPAFPSISRPALVDLLPTGNSGCISPPRIGTAAGIDVSQRNTPALFGANLIDAIPDRLIIANERKQKLAWGLAKSDIDSFPVGRAIRLVDGHVGKFGWKAHVASLSDFVRVACANELGLGNSRQTQPASMSKRDYRAPGLDLTDRQCDQLTAFVASLPRPVEMSSDPVQTPHAARGKSLFTSIGCSDCHIANLGEAKGIYSDLLLHRMGATLVGGGSYGDPPPVLPDFKEGGGPQPSEWRTPPLWGVADSAPYLHDGRAATLRQAIELHGGQARTSAEKFDQLPDSQKQDLVIFLRTLRAPQQTETKPPAA